MRVLVVSIGTYGDVLPFIGLAAELGRRGHDVTLATSDTFALACARAGVDFEPLISQRQYAGLFEHPHFWRPFRGARRLFSALPDFLKPTYDFVARNNVPGETLVIASALAIGARVAHETLGVPVVSVHLTPIMFVSRAAPPRLPFMAMTERLPPALSWRLQTGLYSEFIGPLLKPGLNRFRLGVGLKPKRRIRSWWHSSQRMLLLFPDWFAPKQADWPSQSRQLDFPRADRFGATSEMLDPELEAFLAAGDPPIAVTFGSARLGSDALYRAAVEACARLGKRCLVLSQQSVKAPKGFEDKAFFSRYAPLSEVLPRCAALVHHGGIGTVSQGFAAGIPQLIAPMAFDQFDHAARIRRLGCGSWIHRFAFRPAKVASALKSLLDSKSVAAACAKAAANSSKTDVIAEACDRIEAEFGPALTIERAVRAPRVAVG